LTAIGFSPARSERGVVNGVTGRLPATVPFVAPDVIERRRGRPFELRLGANESMFGPSPRAVAAAARALRHAAWYGDPESHELRERLAALTGTSRERILVGSGIDDLLGLATRCVLEPGDAAVASAGTYATFGYHVRAQGAELVEVPYGEDMSVDLDALAGAADAVDARVVYVANPDNPSGTLCAANELEALASGLPPGRALFVDEAYFDFVADRRTESGLGERVLRFRTFSKGHGIAGLRIGYLLAEREYLAAFEKVRVQFGVNRVAQAAARAALEDPSHLEWVVGETARERERYRALGERFGWRAIPSSTNFIAFDVGDAGLAAEWVDALERRNVFVRRGGKPPLDRCVRVTVGMAEQRQQLEPILTELAPQLDRARNGGDRGADRG
jgi:histidinol-phosphate aminotransferase